jgi:hypothetical protein
MIRRARDLNLSIDDTEEAESFDVTDASTLSTFSARLCRCAILPRQLRVGQPFPGNR